MIQCPRPWIKRSSVLNGWTQASAANVLGRWKLSFCRSFPTVLRWVTGKKPYWFHAPDPTKKEVDVTERSTFQLNYLLFTVACFAIILEKWRLCISLINFQWMFSFYLLCCVLQQSGHWEAIRCVRSSLYLLHGAFFSDCLVHGSILSND